MAFHWTREGNTDIYALPVGAADPIRLTTDPAPDRAPAWSPDGIRLAFESRRDGNWEVYVLDTGDGHLLRLTEDLAYDGGPGWSPDGQWIVFESYRDYHWALYVVAIEGGTPQPLDTGPYEGHSPAWSPDGEWIAFVTQRDGHKEIYAVSAPGTPHHELINLTSHPVDDQDPAWSPDGHYLAFTSDRDGNKRVYIKDVALSLGAAGPGTTTRMRVLTDSSQAFSPTWSPDGQSVAYSFQHRYHWRRGPGGWSVLAKPVFSRDLAAQLFIDGGDSGHPSWTGASPVLKVVACEEHGSSPQATAAPAKVMEVVSESGPPYELKTLPDVEVGIPKLSDRVDDSFNQMRTRVVEETGYDFLAVLSEAFRPIGFRGDGSSYRSWHKAGRAIDLRMDFVGPAGERLMELVREDLGWRTFWRLYLRTARQDGSQGEPLREAPWDFQARFGEAEAAEAGGWPMPVPPGYYVDFTAIASQYGWTRIPSNQRSNFDWRKDWRAIEYWHYENRGGLSWWEAMQELYDQETLQRYF